MKINPTPLPFFLDKIRIRMHNEIINISEPKKEKNLKIAVFIGLINLLI